MRNPYAVAIVWNDDDTIKLSWVYYTPRALSDAVASTTENLENVTIHLVGTEMRLKRQPAVVVAALSEV